MFGDQKRGLLLAKSRRRAVPSPSWRNWARLAGLGFGLGLAAMSGAASAAAEPADEDAVLFDTVPAMSQLGFTPGAEVFSIDERTPDIGEYIKNTETIDGLFRLYRFPRTGKLLMEIRVDQIGKDFLYFAQTVDGPLSAGHFRGAHRDAKIVRFVRQFDRIEIVERNTQFYIDPASPLSRAAGANVTDSILTSMEIVAAAKDGKTVVVDVTRSFLTEELQQIKPSEDPYEIKGREFLLGDLSSTKTRYRTIRNYPANTDVAVAYVYDNPYPLNRGDEDITDPRSVTITLQHSFIALADSDYVPRRDD
ncbi:MAG: DUF5117 domain-containing protein, partial [Pirellulaceae bacterium]